MTASGPDVARRHENHSDEPGPRRRALILAILCMSLLVVSMDNTIVTVALPALRADLGASISGLQWTVDAYTLVLACFLMLAGASGDRIGRRRTFQTGLAVFGLGSLLCSLAPSVGWLVAARVVQALGGAMLNPVALSILTNVVTDPGERARAIGFWGATFGVSLGLGPVLGGVLTEAVGWRAIFWVNVPIVLAAIVLTAVFVPESRAPLPRRPDPVGQALVIVVLGTLVGAVIEAPNLGWGSPEILGLFALGALALAGLLAWERRRREPLLELRFFASVPFSSATGLAVSGFAAFSGFLFLSTLYLQEVRGLASLAAGLMLLPAAVGVVVCAPIAGRLVAGRGARLPLLIAGVTTTAAAVASTSRQTGQAFGIAMAGTIVASAATTAAGLPGAWSAVAIASAMIVILGLVATTARARATAERAMAPAT